MAVLSTSDDIGQVLVVTVVYFVVYYAFMVQQLQGKAYRGSQDSAAIELDRMCDRTFLNCLEQMVPFTLALWLHALFVDAWVSAVLGWVAVVARLLFPVFWSLDGHWNWKVELSTQPYYCCVMYFLFALFCRGVWDVNLYDQVPGWAFFLVVLGGYMLMFLIAAILGFGMFRLNKIHFKVEDDGHKNVRM